MKKMNVIVVFDKNLQKTLMCKRTKEPYMGMYNLVGGKIEKENEGLNEAYRELEEETGFKAGNVEWLMTSRSMVAFCNEKVEIFVATDLIPSEQNLDEEESIELEEYTMEELKEKIFKGEIQDSKTVAGLLAYAVKYNK